jgi:ferrous iron transport protein B
MGLTNHATGMHAVDFGLAIQKQHPDDLVIALAGNPNVGKSTVFNALTGMNQHTGNWPGKTVANAQGCFSGKKHGYVLVDIPGTYSLMAHSAEEEVARNFICFGKPDGVVVVCDATCLERNLNLVLQTLEMTSNVVVCVNLMDEASRKHVKLDLSLISKRLGVPVVGTVAQKKKTLAGLVEELDRLPSFQASYTGYRVPYSEPIEEAIGRIEPVMQNKWEGRMPARWLSLKLIEQDPCLMKELEGELGKEFLKDEELYNALVQAREILASRQIDGDRFRDLTVSALVGEAETICRGAITYETRQYAAFDRKLDRILTSRKTGYPVMLLLLALIFWLTITGANYPSALLAKGLFWVQDRLMELFTNLHAPKWLAGALVLGVYRVLAWVVSVMLPPMAIFFPLFTLLEDAGYLPRIAYNLDRPFKRCSACGKQALCMWVVEDGMRTPIFCFQAGGYGAAWDSYL